MPAPRVPRLRARTRQGLLATAVAVSTVAALTASRPPGVASAEPSGQGRPAGEEAHAPSSAAPAAPPVAAPPGDGSYHTELPPLVGPVGALGPLAPGVPAAPATPGQTRRIQAESGLPATVLRAYRAAETSVGRTDPGCRLPWQLLAAIGKVESGQARGGAVDRNGTTLGRITGPALDGNGFALILDTDGGAHDGDPVYDRAVGPMQFLPSTWSRWGADGNGDGRADPNNVFDAALAAGHYLCAGTRDLGVPADLDRAVLSYNNSRAYLDLVRYWLDFYRRGVHTVPDGKGVVPRSPGAGGTTPATKPTDRPKGNDGGKGGGIVIGPDPSGTPSPAPSPTRPSPSPTPTPSPKPTGRPSTTPSPTPTPTASDTPAPPSPSDTPSPEPSPTTGEPTPSPTTPCPSDSATPSPTPQDPREATTAEEPCAQ
ncbi:lytic transglycosylase domain-containing protein [Streptomyces sp. NPDC048182]|uniref:lytic transglycosylase domain-containing protein n=1 Tax=Streptomyces sp. NPDC048182 TaxID=3365507 RepID=UPI0037126F9A